MSTSLRPISRRTLLPLIATAALSPALLVQSARAQGANWQIYRPEGLGFEVAMPGAPKIIVEKGGRDEPWVRSTSAEVDFDPWYFIVSYTEYTEEPSIAELTADQRMIARQLGAEPQRATAITMNGFQGLDFVGESDSFSMAKRIVIREKWMIEALATGAGSISANPSVRHFLDSFKLLP